MERNVQLNWKNIVEAAVARRKSLNITQKRLAAIAGVSTPTISRFENCSDKIELSSAFAILDSLGMLTGTRFKNDEEWKTKDDEHWVHERGAVGFTGYYRGQEIRCFVSHEAVEDNLDNNVSEDKMVRAVKRNRKLIQNAINEKIQSGKFEEGKESVVVLTSRELSEALASSRRK